MWPFTGKRIFGSRWWAIGFVLFVCWQVTQFTSASDDDQVALNVEQAKAMTDALNKF